MEYLDPALLDGHKFDVRSYLLVASLDPLLVFYHDGFVRRVLFQEITKKAVKCLFNVGRATLRH